MNEPHEPDWGARAVRIEKTYRPKDWPAQIAQLPEIYRFETDRYLRSIAYRIRVVRRVRGR